MYVYIHIHRHTYRYMYVYVQIYTHAHTCTQGPALLRLQFLSVESKQTGTGTSEQLLRTWAPQVRTQLPEDDSRGPFIFLAHRGCCTFVFFYCYE